MKTQKISTAEIKELLAERGIKATAQRIAVCSYVLCDGCHVTAEQIKEKMDEVFPMMSLATVYNTLNFLVEKEVLKAIKLEDTGKTIYDTNLRPHFHVYKKSTGEIFDLDPSEVELKFKKSDYQVQDLVLTVA